MGLAPGSAWNIKGISQVTRDVSPHMWGTATSCSAATSQLLLQLSTAQKGQLNSPRLEGNKHLQQHALHPHCTIELQKNVVCKGLVEVTRSNPLPEAGLTRPGVSAIVHLGYFGGPPCPQQCLHSKLEAALGAGPQRSYAPIPGMPVEHLKSPLSQCKTAFCSSLNTPATPKLTRLS